jgi:putative heme iron utilization protein
MKNDMAFDARLAAKKLLREGRSGALATLVPGSGDPYCSLVNVATAVDGAPLFLLSKLALHTKNILADDRVSLMLDERKAGDPLEGARIMLMGTCAARPILGRNTKV